MNWITLNLLEDKFVLPRVSCCYVLFFDGCMKYVGSTNDLRNRFSGHAIRYGYAKELITPWGEFHNCIDISVKYKPSKRHGDWLMTEARLIKRLQPEFNSKLKGRKK